MTDRPNQRGLPFVDEALDGRPDPWRWEVQPTATRLGGFDVAGQCAERAVAMRIPTSACARTESASSERMSLSRLRST